MRRSGAREPGRGMRCGRWVFGALTCVVPTLLPAAPLPLRMETSIHLEIDPLLIRRGDTRSLGRLVLDVPPDHAGSLRANLDGPPEWGRLRLELDARGRAGADDEDLSVTLAARLAFPDGRSANAARSLSIAEGATGLFEVFEAAEDHLVLAIKAERVTRPVAARLATGLGPEIAFRLEIERSEEGRFIPLESNLLSTFVGQAVGYSFRLGPEEAVESIRVTLTPATLHGDLVEIDVDVSGTLPGTQGPVLLAKRERIVASRGATSSVVVSAGEPPKGYRFRVTPVF